VFVKYKINFYIYFKAIDSSGRLTLICTLLILGRDVYFNPVAKQFIFQVTVFEVRLINVHHS